MASVPSFELVNLKISGVSNQCVPQLAGGGQVLETH
jgi:hypothetical protein